jgi:hypothetical protein
MRGYGGVDSETCEIEGYISAWGGAGQRRDVDVPTKGAGRMRLSGYREKFVGFIKEIVRPWIPGGGIAGYS